VGWGSPAGAGSGRSVPGWPARFAVRSARRFSLTSRVQSVQFSPLSAVKAPSAAVIGGRPSKSRSSYIESSCVSAEPNFLERIMC